ncbi:SMP-30/gluconolactonase/LRE family protein [Embleya scabrispora]|uniref:SMP-30/gluconolactonase/LRE family protein n=1 Tax=Embleya scabrispora TaxID=159449 RepID=UPI0003824E9C|nr:SMP-30/gluconolactonase/LRE family protein [Embleya scabrispora]MYS80544.1 SMP-30/gluconolactonase/LRE family protein [Streptomyces sp. SID5474]
MLAIDITVAVPGTARVGEGPFWDAATSELTWVDILDGAIHTADPTRPHPRTTILPTLVGAAVPKRSGGFVAATAEGFMDIRRDGIRTTRRTVLPPGRRMNDAKCDPAGRLWAGSCDLDLAPARGALHVLDTDWTVHHVLDDLTQPNGLGWSPDGHTFYLIDTAAREVGAFDLPPDRLALGNRRTLARFSSGGGAPDGMAIDAEGCLWIAMWGGGRLVRVAPDGRLLGEVPLPVAQPSSCAFGGPDLDVLYVTTAREGLGPHPVGPAGSVLAVRGLGVRGLPVARFGG